MANRRLTPEELEILSNPLLAEVRGKLRNLSNGNPESLFALRRKLTKELSYDKRGKPMQRKLLKATKCAQQLGKCASCHCDLEPMGKNAVLDRTEAMQGYVAENVSLVSIPATANCKLNATTPSLIRSSGRKIVEIRPSYFQYLLLSSALARLRTIAEASGKGGSLALHLRGIRAEIHLQRQEGH